MSQYNIEIEDFLPKYPDIRQENFDSEIYRKQEFRELELSTEPEPRPDEQGALLKHQKIVQRFLSSHTLYDELIMNWHMGSGKCFKMDTEILLYDGTIRKIQDISVGDQLMGDDSTPRIVSELIRGEDEMYDIIPTKGDKYTVNSEHILCLKPSSFPSLNHSKNDRNWRVEWVENNKFCSKNFCYTKTTSEIERQNAENFRKTLPEQILEISVKDYLKLSNGRKAILKGYRTGVDFEKKNVPFDPYMFGAWLGDRISRDDGITNKDSSVVKYFATNLPKYDLSLSFGERYSYRITGNGQVNKFRQFLKDYNLVNNKHIPHIFKCNSRQVRLGVLAGILDTDGYYDTGCFELTQKNEKLFDDIIYLCRSLGFSCYKNKKKTNWIHKGIKKQGFAYRMMITGNGIEDIPTKIPRKQAQPRQQKKDPLVSKIKVVPVGRDKYYGVTVDSNHRYLLGDFTVTHNSCGAIGTVENIFRETNRFKRAVVITVNEDLVINMKNQILNSCTSADRYPLPEDFEVDEYIPKHEQQKAIQKEKMKLLRGNYEFHTYYSFYQSIRGINPEILKQRYSNCIIIIDEVHHLTSSKWYNYYHQFLHLIENRKILLMSGTLMRNYVFELGIILNLILPLSQQINIDQTRVAGKDIEFKNTKDGDVIEEQFIAEYVKNDTLKTLLRGRISYLGQTVTVPIIHRGRRDIFPNLTIFEDEMSQFQYNTLASIQDKGYKIKSQQASLFVFPNGEYGSKAWEHYEKNKKEWKQIFSGKNDEGKLNALRVYSAKYANTIQSILRYPKQNTFVFNTFIRGGGAKTLGMCLEQFGFSLVTNSKQITGKGKRYAILSSEFIKDKNELLEIVRRFNRENNKNGDYISVLIGGRKVSEGVSFRNIENVHILSPHWNFSLIDQAIARGIRVFSHSKRNANVNVFLHASTKRNERGELESNLVDVDIYKTALEKDKRIRKVQRIVKESAFDCALTYNQNVERDTSKDGTRECDYQDCLYRCNVDRSLTTDSTTYDLYYTTNIVESSLQILFRKHFFISIQELYELVQKYTDASFFQVCKIVIDMIEKSVPFINRYGLECFMKFENDMLYLSENRFSSNSISDTYYTQNPILNDGKKFEEIVDQVQMKHQLDIICSHPSITAKQNMLKGLPNYVKQAFRKIVNE